MKKRWLRTKVHIHWQAIEQPTGTVIRQSFFEEDVEQLVNFQNKNRQWQLMVVYQNSCVITLSNYK
jgi:hypothetical protein